MENEPPLYLGLYIDDFICFSESDRVEQHFETEFQKHVPVTFNKEANYFLVVKFQHEKKKNGHL